jgi:hypothetical protein
MAACRSLESPNMYTVGWIAALPIERAAATAMLDERHEKPRNLCNIKVTQIHTRGAVWESTMS